VANLSLTGHQYKSFPVLSTQPPSSTATASSGAGPIVNLVEPEITPSVPILIIALTRWRSFQRRGKTPPNGWCAFANPTVTPFTCFTGLLPYSTN